MSSSDDFVYTSKLIRPNGRILMSRADGKCNRCEADNAETRYSYGVYAGFLCFSCAISSYRDGCGLIDGRQGNPADLDEPLDEPE